jgi:hypothetical protein
MDDYMDKLIPRIEQGLTLQQWVDELDNDQLTTLGNAEDDKATQLKAITAAYFAKGETGRDSYTEGEMEEMTKLLDITLSCEANVREGRMVRRGEPKVIGGTARYSLTEAGKKYVEDMIDGNRP